MKWLLWREYRLNRLILATGAVLLLLPYLFVLRALGAHANYVIRELVDAAYYSLFLSQLTMALLGGSAIAGERADRSAEFIAYLPLARTRLVGAKLSLAFLATVVIWGTNLLVFWTLMSLFPRFQSDPDSSYNFAAFMASDYYIAITGLTFFGVSWLISSFQSSTVFAVCGGLVVPLLIFIGLLMEAESSVQEWTPDEFTVEIWYATICPILAVVCFSIGTWYYLTRVEP